MIKRLDWDNLDYDYEDSVNVYTYDGQPFSGIAYEKLDDGTLEEITMIGGRYNGIARTWYPSGRLKKEECFFNNILHGIYWEWFPSGNLQIERVYEFGVKVRELIFNEDEKVESKFAIDKTHQHFEGLILKRKSFRINFGK